MKIIRSIEYHPGTKEEKLPGYTPGFPYISTRSELDKYREKFVPWHWHKAIELFYMESGELRYYTPGGTTLFKSGSAGMVNSNVIHMTKVLSHNTENVQLLHIFDPHFIAGGYENTIEEKYVTPLITAPRLEIISFDPNIPAQKDIIDLIIRAFQLPEHAFGYEIQIRQALSDLWLKILELSYPLILEKSFTEDTSRDKLKLMMIYIHEHYEEKITIRDVAAAGFSSERECYRVFQKCLHTSPIEYTITYRLQIACNKLANGGETVTQICQNCGFGNSSYFGKVFREYTGMSPSEYRHTVNNGRIVI